MNKIQTWVKSINKQQNGTINIQELKSEDHKINVFSWKETEALSKQATNDKTLQK